MLPQPSGPSAGNTGPGCPALWSPCKREFRLISIRLYGLSTELVAWQIAIVPAAACARNTRRPTMPIPTKLRVRATPASRRTQRR
jgi:hypothetical protein